MINELGGSSGYEGDFCIDEMGRIIIMPINPTMPFMPSVPSFGFSSGFEFGFAW